MTRTPPWHLGLVGYGGQRLTHMQQGTRLQSAAAVGGGGVEEERFLLATHTCPDLKGVYLAHCVPKKFVNQFLSIKFCFPTDII